MHRTLLLATAAPSPVPYPPHNQLLGPWGPHCPYAHQRPSCVGLARGRMDHTSGCWPGRGSCSWGSHHWWLPSLSGGSRVRSQRRLGTGSSRHSWSAAAPALPCPAAHSPQSLVRGPWLSLGGRYCLSQPTDTEAQGGDHKSQHQVPMSVNSASS